MRAVKLTEKIYWVGAVDWDLRNFHGYLTQKGSTYNAYLVMDEKITLIDTVKGYLSKEMFSRISEIVDPAKIDYIISNHAEMDHSGALPEIIKFAKNAEIICSPNGEKALREHYKSEWKFRAVKSGEKISTGKYNFQFFHTPMVHWPDNMVTYLPEEKILFSNDAFGQHIASAERFDDEYPLETIILEAKKYFANIVLPYCDQVKKALEALAGLDIKMIAPSHGIIWRNHIAEILKEYTRLSSSNYTKNALVIYDTMWNSTKKIAESIADAFQNKGYNARLMNLQHNHISDIMTEVADAEYICVGSPTLNNNMLPTVAAFLTYFKGLAPKNRKGMAFGSFGWGGQAVQLVEQELKSCGMELLEQVKIKYIPDESALTETRKKLEEKIDERN